MLAGLLALLLTALAGLLPNFAAAASSLNDTERYRAFVQEQQNLTPAQALAQLRSMTPPKRSVERSSLFVSMGLMKQPLWFLTPVPRSADFIVVSGGWQDRYDLALVSGDQVLTSYASGSAIPAATRPIRDPRSVIRIPDGVTDVDLLVRDSGTGTSISYPIEFQSEREYGRGLRLLHLRHGAYYGLTLLLLYISIGAAIASPQPATIYFTVYLCSSAVLLGCQDGFLSFYLLPDSPRLMPALPHISLGILLMAALLFGLHFLGMKDIAPRFSRAVRLLAGAFLVHGFVNGWLQSQAGAIIEMAGSILAGLLMICAAVIANKHQVTGARIYLLSRLPTLLATIAFIGNNWALQSITLSLDALFVGIALEMLILSIALSFRLNSEQLAVSAAKDREEELGAQIDQLQLITEEANQLRKVQHSAQEIHRVRTINQIAGGVAHDFNNILTSVMGFAELLKDPELRLSDSQRHKFGTEVHRAGSRGAELVQQLLTYSRSATPDVAHHDLVAITLEALNLVRPGLDKRIKLEVSLPDDSLRCMLDAKQWRQVVVNLVTNAAESMNGTGTVDLTLQRAALSNQQCSACRQMIRGERVILTIRDSGSGVEEPISDLFTPFHTTKSIGNGSGLGLSVVDGIVHEHGGHLVMANRTNQPGVQIDIALPCEDQHAASSQEQTRLLLVSSDSQTVAATREKLQRYYEVTSASRASSAIANFLDNRARFGLVAIEVQADNHQWLEVASNVRRASPATPILFLTADQQASQILKQHGELQQSQTTQILNLETDIDSLLTTIETLLKPNDEQSQNVASLRTALRRLKKQNNE
ncbi:MAG: 7TM diverse intracellular signaling domain-containing protein [Pseudomonadales bacterium]